MVHIPKPLIYVSVFGTVCGGAYLVKYVKSFVAHFLVDSTACADIGLLTVRLFFLFSPRDMFSGKDYKLKTSAANKVIIVTGANTGLGKEAAKLLAIKNATVVMACRDLEKCEKVNAYVSLYIG